MIRRTARLVFPSAVLLALLMVRMPTSIVAHDREEGYEVWLVDQSNSPGKAYGGSIAIFDGEDVSGRSASRASPVATIDLGGATAALCMAETAANPVRPHMIFFNAEQSHAVLSFVASGHVVFFNAASREPVACLRASVGAGGARQAHAAFPAPDDGSVLVANQNGKLLERILTDYETETFVLDTAGTLNLATCTTPNGVACQHSTLRPDNAPICAFVPSDNGAAFVSLRGGGLFVVDHTATPMTIVGEYTTSHVGGNGCGFVEARGRVFLTSGGGTAANLFEFAAYRMPMTGYSAQNPPGQPQVQLLFKDDAEHRDAHGTVATRKERYVWMLDRAANVAEVFEAITGDRINTVNLVSPLSADPTPDLGVVSPDGSRIFVSLRGPVPLTGDPHASTGTTPGLGVIQVHADGRRGAMKAIARISNIEGGVERADPHGIGLRVVER